MADLKDEILEEVTKMIESVKKNFSEFNIGGNLPKHIRQPPNMPTDTPEWGKTLSEYLTERMDDIEVSLGRSIDLDESLSHKCCLFMLKL